MNKIFIALMVFGFSISSAQPTSNEQQQCASQNKMVLNMANLVDRIAKGEGKYY